MLSLILTQMTATIPDERPTISAALERLLEVFHSSKEGPDYRQALIRQTLLPFPSPTLSHGHRCQDFLDIFPLPMQSCAVITAH